MKRKTNSSASFRKNLRASSDDYSHTTERERESGRQTNTGMGKDRARENSLCLTKTQLPTAYLSSPHWRITSRAAGISENRTQSNTANKCSFLTLSSLYHLNLSSYRTQQLEHKVDGVMLVYTNLAIQVSSLNLWMTEYRKTEGSRTAAIACNTMRFRHHTCEHKTQDHGIHTVEDNTHHP